MSLTAAILLGAALGTPFGAFIGILAVALLRANKLE